MNLPEPTPDVPGETPAAVTNDAVPEVGEETHLEVPPEAPQPTIQSQGKGKEVAIPDHSIARGTPSMSPRSSGGRPIPGATEPRPREQGGGSRRIFSNRQRGEDDWELRAHLKRGDSVLLDPSFAIEYFNNLAMPLDKKAMEGWSNRRLIEQEILGSVQGLYRSLVMRNLMLHHAGRIDFLGKQKKELEDKLAKAESDRERELQKANAKLGEISSERESLEIQVKIAREKTDLVEGRLSIMEGEKKALEEKAISLSSLLKITDNSLTSTEMRLASVEQRASEDRRHLEGAVEEAREETREVRRQAEEDRRIAEAKILEADKQQQAAEARAEAAEIRAQAAVEKAQGAVAGYKASVAFQDDVADAGVGMFLTGFEDCKNLVSGAFPGIDLSKIIPPGAEEGEEEEEEEEEGGGGGGEQPADLRVEQPEVPLPPTCSEAPAGAQGSVENNEATAET